MNSHDPLTQVVDHPLAVNETMMERLREFRAAPKLKYLPGVDVYLEKERLSKAANDLADHLIEFLPQFPTKLWAMQQFQFALNEVRFEETEGREHFGVEMEQLMDILGIESSDGLLSFYLGGM